MNKNIWKLNYGVGKPLEECASQLTADLNFYKPYTREKYQDEDYVDIDPHLIIVNDLSLPPSYGYDTATGTATLDMSKIKGICIPSAGPHAIDIPDGAEVILSSTGKYLILSVDGVQTATNKIEIEFVEDSIPRIVAEDTNPRIQLTKLVVTDKARAVEDSAFYGVFDSAGVMRSGSNGFDGTDNGGLDLHLGDNLETIGKRAFAGMSIYGMLYIPDSVRHLGKGAFEFSSILKLRLSENPLLDTIPMDCFNSHNLMAATYKYKWSIKSVYIPDNIKYIGKNAFNQPRLDDLHLGANVRYIGSYAFDSGFMDVTNVKMPQGCVISCQAFSYSGGYMSYTDCVSTTLPLFYIPDTVKMIYGFGGYKDRMMSDAVLAIQTNNEPIMDDLEAQGITLQQLATLEGMGEVADRDEFYTQIDRFSMSVVRRKRWLHAIITPNIIMIDKKYNSFANIYIQSSQTPLYYGDSRYDDNYTRALTVNREIRICDQSTSSTRNYYFFPTYYTNYDKLEYIVASTQIKFSGFEEDLRGLRHVDISRALDGPQNFCFKDSALETFDNTHCASDSPWLELKYCQFSGTKNMRDIYLHKSSYITDSAISTTIDTEHNRMWHVPIFEGTPAKIHMYRETYDRMRKHYAQHYKDNRAFPFNEDTFDSYMANFDIVFDMDTIRTAQFTFHKQSSKYNTMDIVYMTTIDMKCLPQMVSGLADDARVNSAQQEAGFVGWNTKPDGSGEYLTESYVPQVDNKFYAIYRHTVKFIVKDEVISYEVNKFATVEYPQVSIPDNYILVGWDKTVDVVVEDVTYNAILQKKKSEGIYVDLGLPSGNLWAKCMIGQSSPETPDADTFPWGDTTGEFEVNEVYDYKIYVSSYFDAEIQENGKETYKKYNVEGGLTELALEDDLAYKTLGEGWRVPSSDDVYELLGSRTNIKLVDDYNGQKVYVVSSINPTEYPDELIIPYSQMYIWTRTLASWTSDRAVASYIGTDMRDNLGGRTYEEYRCYLHSIRPVYTPQGE